MSESKANTTSTNNTSPNTTTTANAVNAALNSKQKLTLPSTKTLLQASKLAIRLNKPICFYFYTDSLKGQVCIASDGKEKIIYKNDEEHTSPIVSPYQVDDEYIIITENTIYIISANTKVEK